MHKNDTAFTLIELLAVIVIIAIIATIGIYSVTKIMTKSSNEALKDTALSARQAAKYNLVNAEGSFPKTINMTPGEVDAKLLDVSKDQWGKDYDYIVAEASLGGGGKQVIDIYLKNSKGCYVLRDGATALVNDPDCHNVSPASTAIAFYDFEDGSISGWTYGGYYNPSAVPDTSDPYRDNLAGTYSARLYSYYSQDVSCAENDTYDTYMYRDFNLATGSYNISFIASNSIGATWYDQSRVSIYNVTDSTTIKEWSTPGCGNGEYVTGTDISFGPLTNYSHNFQLTSPKTIRFYARAHNGGWQSHMLIDNINLSTV